ncbi:hypothetical protein acsn021_03110 [Anaerocolumna cellulosilytica]|uniref:Uncharacterized protein n=1 Tax=Anaerocolumna cellulosilytica TaxID=433286 RepID=A0A6S6QZM7_9FIRM|nr:tocopherol cyclase family protein [Anaerocolumna cellulosilytica]MBB5197299.1 hypothetical protein [Anaerocolumna cellulosilytica]BCJ92742.1 hypothetical protein acsn021_03110 [Anaerocolumna cellulosilytica]
MRRHKTFEGWYFKHQNNDTVLAFIPGKSVDETGKSRVFLQIIWNEDSYSLDFNEEEYKVDKYHKRISIGNNVFSKQGVRVDIQSKDITLKGIIRYGCLNPIRYTIMGPFQYLPMMECKHEVISMSHALQGKIMINGRVLVFNGGQGYIEGDSGCSFPKDYLWLQCNRFEENEASIMISVAHIPFLGLSFKGCICVIHYKGKEYRFATYLGTRVICSCPKAIVLSQGNYRLKVYLSEQSQTQARQEDKKLNFSHSLLAPLNGLMNRYIKEEHLLQGRFLLFKKGKLTFDLFSNYVSYEYVE